VAGGGGEERDPQPVLRGAGDVADRQEPRRVVAALGLAEERGGVAHRPGEIAVDDDAQRHLPVHRVERQPAAGGLEADQAVDRGRDADRAAAVVAVRERDGSGRDERGCPGGRGARVALGVPRAADRSEPRVVGGRRETELRQLRLAERDDAHRLEQPGDVAVVRSRPADVRVAPLLGRQPRHVDVVLDERRDAVEEAGRAVRPPGPVVVADRHRVELAVDLLDPRDRRLDQLARIHLAGGDPSRQPDRVIPPQRVVHEGIHHARHRSAHHPRRVGRSSRSEKRESAEVQALRASSRQKFSRVPRTSADSALLRRELLPTRPSYSRNFCRLGPHTR